MYIRTIIVDGVDNPIDMKNVLSEHLNVVLGTNILKYKLHESSH